jgi:hypothetical protein
MAAGIQADAAITSHDDRPQSRAGCATLTAIWEMGW